MIEDMRPKYTSILLGSTDEKDMRKWLGSCIQELYREGYPDVLICSELAEMLVR